MALVLSGCRLDKVVRVIDGDTVNTAMSTIRLQGVDTPEAGECGFAEAKGLVEALVADAKGDVLVVGDGDLDKYGREIAYLIIDGRDVGEMLLRMGLATARYDSRDGYATHDNEVEYHQIDDASANFGCPAPPVTAPPATAPPATAPPTTLSSGSGSYYKNCTEARNAGVTPIYRGQPGYGSHLDRDDDGIACE